MNNWWREIGILALSGSLLLSGGALASDRGGAYEVTISNITRGEIFTPIMVATHPRGVKVFELAQPAGTGLAMLAESGDSGLLGERLRDEGAHDIVSAEDVLPPGASLTLTVATNGKSRYLSVASMLVPSNDAFFAVNGVRGPRGRNISTLYSPAYDAGTEFNDELCVSIPGPPFICQGEGFNADDGEGYVHIHPGIQGVGDLVPAKHDWRNPVATISVRFVRR